MVLGNIKGPTLLNFTFNHDDDDDDDDDKAERTRTGPYAVRPDVEHQVHHNVKISHFAYFTISAHTKKAGQQARAKRGVWP